MVYVDMAGRAENDLKSTDRTPRQTTGACFSSLISISARVQVQQVLSMEPTI